MIIIDTSALVAMSQYEADASVYDGVVRRGGPMGVPASAYLEFAMVSRGWRAGRAWLEQFLTLNEVALMAIDATTARRAADAFERYGRGSGHPARLNFGHCLSYAVAVEHDAPLLFKGEDFAHTDVKRAL